jgi:hypothetical protein
LPQPPRRRLDLRNDDNRDLILAGNFPLEKCLYEEYKSYTDPLRHDLCEEYVKLLNIVHKKVMALSFVLYSYKHVAEVIERLLRDKRIRRTEIPGSYKGETRFPCYLIVFEELHQTSDDFVEILRVLLGPPELLTLGLVERSLTDPLLLDHATYWALATAHPKEASEMAAQVKAKHQTGMDWDILLAHPLGRELFGESYDTGVKEGIEKGIEKGRREGLELALQKLIDSGMTESEARQILQIPLFTVQ